MTTQCEKRRTPSKMAGEWRPCILYPDLHYGPSLVSVVLEAAEFLWARPSSHKSMRSYIVYCCLTKGLRVCTIRAYQMCLDNFPQVDLNAATEINWNLPGE